MNNKSQAVVIVVVFLAMFFIIGLAFFVLSQTEKVGAITHINTIRSRYIAEAGIKYAKKVLQADKRANVIDSFGDLTFKQFEGNDADANGDGAADARWLPVSDSDGKVFGRFAVHVTDEASKLNVNYCSKESLDKLLTQLSLDTAFTGKILAARPFDAVEEIGSLIGKEPFRKLRDFVTVYSREEEVDLSGNRRVYLNSANRQLILDTLTARGVDDARTKAALLVDAADDDVTQTVFTEFTAGNLVPTTLSEAGDWKARDGYYESPLNGRAGTFTWSNVALEDGTYACYVFGVDSSDVVGVVGGKYLRSGEKCAQPVSVSGGTFSLLITPAADAPCRFVNVQLTRETPGGVLDKKVVTGAEAVVINELMVNLRAQFSTGGGDLPPGASAHYEIATGLRPGFYGVQLFSSSGGYVGDVTVAGRGANAVHSGDYLQYGVELRLDGKLSIDVRNNDPVKHASLGSVVLSQQPDCEYIELLNLSGQAVDIGNFSVEVYTPADEIVKGWPGRIPAGTVLQPYQYAVLAVDDSDGGTGPSKLAGNGVSLRRTWGYGGVPLDFEDYQGIIDESFDLLPDAGAKIILKNAHGMQVDAVEYQAFQVVPFTSLERSDPTARIDSDHDGFLDGWYASSAVAGGTPANVNENLGMYTNENNEIIRHSPAEIALFNRKLSGLLEVSQLSGGREWNKFTLTDVARMCDAFAYDAAVFTGNQDYPGGTSAQGGITASAGSALEWEFNHVPAGSYWLTIEGADCKGASVSVATACSPENEFGIPSHLIFTGNRAHYGKVIVGGTKEGTVRIKVSGDSLKNVGLTSVLLEPLLYEPGRINLNTASAEVLRTVFDTEEVVQRVIKSRPLGDAGGQRLGVGDAILLDSRILPFHKKLTVKSDVYELQCVGQYLLHDKAPASVNIRLILERGT